MERDFMGLAVKQEISDEPIDAAPLRSAAMHWPLSNKASAHPQFLSFHGSHEEKPKTGFDSLASAGLVTITTTEIDSDQKSYPGVMQKNFIPENQGGVRYTVTTYPTKHLDSHAINQTKMTVSPAMCASFVAAPGQYPFVPLSPQPISAVPMVNPVPTIPSCSPVVGTTNLRNASKISGAPAQLTIFYNGTVCVYDNVSADKAQAIMLLAGNGPSTTSTAAPVQASTPRPSILESFVVSHPYSATTHRSSPATKTSINISQSVGWSGAISDMAALKQGAILASSNKVEPMKVGSSPGSISATFLPSSTVPQFRRKSLARFLEKRKERVISEAPYADKESPECNSSGSCPVPAVN